MADSTTESLEADVGRFFDRFVEAFATFEGPRVAALYHAPFFAVGADGSVDRLDSREQIGRLFQSFLDGYHREGCRRTRFVDLAVVRLGGRSVVGTVTWELVADDACVVRRWRESYNLLRAGDGWQVLVSTDHLDE